MQIGRAAIAESRESELPFLEMLAHRDLIDYVLDTRGRDERQSQMAELGGAISRMVLPPSAYAEVLGPGIDAEAAAAAFKKKRSEVAGSPPRYSTI